MSVSRSPTRLPARSVAYGPTSDVRGGYDPDALDYFARAEGLGGSFDLSSIDASYTTAYVKTAINNFVVGCKADSVWDKLTEFYLLTGVSFDGLMAKLKYDSVATLTNNNFVTGDYLAAGSGAGLTSGSTKFLDSNFSATEIDPEDHALFLYDTEGAPDGVGWESFGTAHIGHFRNYFRRTNSNELVYYTLETAETTGVIGFKVAFGGGMLIGTRSTTSAKLFLNGSVFATRSASGVHSGSLNRNYKQPWNPVTNGRATVSGICTGLTDTEAANLSTRVNALMTALGANVY